jgi:DNA repair protein RadC
MLNQKIYSFRVNIPVVREATEVKINGPEKAFDILKEISDASQEMFVMLTLDQKNNVIDKHIVTIGCLNASLAHPREVFKRAIMDSAASIIVAHNHPSGDCKPSLEDISLTKQLVKGGNLLGIPVQDHIVIGRDKTPFHSIRESGAVDFNA